MTSHSNHNVSLMAVCAVLVLATATALADPVESSLPTSGTDASVGFRDTGAFMTCWRMPVDEDGIYSPWRVVVQRYTSAGTINGSYDHVSADSSDSTNPSTYAQPAMFVSRNGTVGAAWTGECRDCRDHANATIVRYRIFSFESTPLPLDLPPDPDGPTQFVPSIGVANAAEGKTSLRTSA